jgi:imidazole glycerol-phosphate synthase subunit HisH
VSWVAIVDTGLCNLDSIARAIEDCGGQPLVTDDPGDLGRAARIVLPGVGAFPEAMARLRSRGLDVALGEQVIGRKIPFLGVCLGMQLIATSGTEVRETAGLGWIDGEVGLLQAEQGERVPHIGWNEVRPTADNPLFRGIAPGRDFYFVHSYVLRPARDEDVASVTPYGGGFVSAVNRGNVYGVQFHPEKSQHVGFAVLRNFLTL